MIFSDRDADSALAFAAAQGAPAPMTLAIALRAMGLEEVCPADVASEFRDPLVRLAVSWEAAIAPSTLASRRCDLRRFTRWCAQHHLTPFASGSILAELMELHVIEVGKALTPGTTKRVGSNLTALAKELDSDRAVRGARERRRLAVRAAQKSEHVRGITHQKPRLTVAQMQAMRLAIQGSPGLALRRLRDIALFDTMCDLLARRSEIVGLRVRDIDLKAATIRIAWSKTDQGGRGAVFLISRRTAEALGAWIAASGLRDVETADAGALPVFPAVMNDGFLRTGPGGVPAPMDGKSVARVLQRYAAPLGVTGVAGHSLRRSMARALYEKGAPEDEIVTKGRWSSLDQMRDYVGLTAPIQGAADMIF